MMLFFFVDCILLVCLLSSLRFSQRNSQAMAGDSWKSCHGTYFWVEAKSGGADQWIQLPPMPKAAATPRGLVRTVPAPPPPVRWTKAEESDASGASSSAASSSQGLDPRVVMPPPMASFPQPRPKVVMPQGWGVAPPSSPSVPVIEIDDDGPHAMLHKPPLPPGLPPVHLMIHSTKIWEDLKQEVKTEIKTEEAKASSSGASSSAASTDIPIATVLQQISELEKVVEKRAAELEEPQTEPESFGPPSKKIKTEGESKLEDGVIPERSSSVEVISEEISCSKDEEVGEVEGGVKDETVEVGEVKDETVEVGEVKEASQEETSEVSLLSWSQLQELDAF
jgi:hypothetical protein